MAEEDEAESNGDRSPEDEFSRTKAIGEKTNKGSKDTHLKASKAGRKGYLCIAPAKFLSDWLKKGSKAIEYSTANIKANEGASEYDPPSIKDFFNHRFYKTGLE